jgi:hypothetical protein
MTPGGRRLEPVARYAGDPLPQRFSRRFSDDDKTIAYRWERAVDDPNWETDFYLTYGNVS